jgi:hypothetical protein
LGVRKITFSNKGAQKKNDFSKLDACELREDRFLVICDVMRRKSISPSYNIIIYNN